MARGKVEVKAPLQVGEADPLTGFLRTQAPSVPDAKGQTVAFQTGFDLETEIGPVAMLEGIFHEHLEREAWNRHSLCRIGDIHLEALGNLEPPLLNLKVDKDALGLLGKAADRTPIAFQIVSQKGGRVPRHDESAVWIVVDLRGDGVERVVEKVRIELRAQAVKLCTRRIRLRQYAVGLGRLRIVPGD